jgi:hypothetical protein
LEQAQSAETEAKSTLGCGRPSGRSRIGTGCAATAPVNGTLKSLSWHLQSEPENTANPTPLYGVQEYLVWRVVDRAFDWFVLQEGVYVNLPADSDVMVRSRVFPGLWLGVADLLAGNLAQVLTGLKVGLESPAYLAFQQSLASKSLTDAD